MATRSHDAPVVVIGGGLAGLTAAVFAARAGRRTILLERSDEMGGRARTQVRDGFHLNLGPHALYRGGEASDVLRELNVPVDAGVPSARGALLLDGEACHTFPAGPASLMTTGFLGWGGKLRLARFLAGLRRLDPAPLHGRTLDGWLLEHFPDRALRRLLRALARLATYTDAPGQQSAGAALLQVQRAFTSGVDYLHGGWRTLVACLRRRAEEAGVRILTGARATAIDHDAAVRAVCLADGSSLAATAVVVAASPAVAAGMLGGEARRTAATWTGRAVPVTVAALDVALSALPRPAVRFALGIDPPLYYSVHSSVARLAPPGGAVIQMARYHRPGSSSEPERDRHEMMDMLDRLQPGWRSHEVAVRFLPSLVVSNAVVRADGDGLAGRPGPAVAGLAGLFVAGDWVGPEGQLADASMHSGRAAGRLAAAVSRRRAAA